MTKLEDFIRHLDNYKNVSKTLDRLKQSTKVTAAQLQDGFYIVTLATRSFILRKQSTTLEFYYPHGEYYSGMDFEALLDIDTITEIGI